MGPALLSTNGRQGLPVDLNVTRGGTEMNDRQLRPPRNPCPSLLAWHWDPSTANSRLIVFIK